jgi:two-component system phosphate regulon sensor histidine kinase PhoR
LVGILGLGYPEKPDPPQSLLRTMSAVARFPAAAVQHARIQEVSDRRARLAEVLRRFGERALSTVSIEALHRVILETAQALTGSDQASITRVEAGKVRVIAGVGKDEHLVGTEAPAAALQEALSPDEPYLVRDVERANPTQLLVKLAKKNGAGSFLALALRHQTRLFGHLFAGCAEAYRYHDDEVEAMRILASMSAAILEQRSAQADAEQQARRLAETIEHLPLLIEVFDGAGAPLRSNEAARVMRERLGCSGGNAVDLFPGLVLRELDGRPFDAAALPSAAALRGLELTPHEVVLARPGGERLATLLVAAAPILAPDGKVESVVVGCQDVTKLHEVARAKDRFLRVAAHELRTPITALHATTQLVDVDPQAFDDPERRTAILARIRRQSVRLVKLVQQLLDSVQANAVELPLLRGPVDLVALARDVAETTMPAIGPRAVIRADAPVIGTWDALRIEQVLTNLLSNAARYSPADAEVTVIVRADAGHALLQVRDTGIGIPAHQLDQLFTPFFRGANAHAHHGSGLGLGLHIAQEIVRRHGGRIHVESQENSGTTFTVFLPLA